MVKARLERDANGSHRIFVQRAKFKHWFELGKHRDSTNLFYWAYVQGSVQWEKDVLDHNSLFDKNKSI